VYVAILSPAVVFALTCDVIVPCVLLTAAPPAFHCQATYEFALAFTSVVSVPRLKPSALSAVKLCASVVSAVVVFDDRYFVTPRDESNKA
jgi:hypothetical protein